MYNVATVLTVHGIETYACAAVSEIPRASCKSTYRSRY